jgi:hypothetical protein
MNVQLRGAVRLTTSLAIVGALALPVLTAQGASTAARGASVRATGSVTGAARSAGSASTARSAATSGAQSSAAAAVTSAGTASGTASGPTGWGPPLVGVPDQTDTGKCDGQNSGTYGPEKKCQKGFIGVWADPSNGVQVEACNGNPTAAPSQAPAQPYGYIYVDSTGKHTPGDYGNQLPGGGGGYIGANNNQSQQGSDAAPCDYQPK